MQHEPYYSLLRPEIVELVPKSARVVLDVGCGTGNLGVYLKETQSATVHGVELVPEVASVARSKLDKVWTQAIEQVIPDLTDGTYDCIVLADVLEHLVDPWSVLRALKAKLTNNGIFVASIPNVQNWEIVSALMQGRFDYCSHGILDRTHLRFFTRKSVQELFWDCGLRIRSLETSKGGSSPAEPLLRAMAKSGLSSASMADDARTFQFLVVAEQPETVSAPRVAIIVQHSDNRAPLLASVTSFVDLRYPSFDVVVLDMGRPDPAVAELRHQRPGIDIVRTAPNLGYAAACNKALQVAFAKGCQYVLLADSHTTAAPDLLQVLTTALSFLPDSSALGAKALFAERPEVISCAGSKWNAGRQMFERIGQCEVNGPAFGHFRQVDHLCGGLLFASLDSFKRIGLMDERFHHRTAEIDWCYRALAQGYRCIVVPDAVVYVHRGAATESESVSDAYFDERNTLLWARKHLNRQARLYLHRHIAATAWRRVFPPFTLASNHTSAAKRLLWSLATWVRGVNRNVRDANKRAALLGLRDYCLGRFGDCPSRLRRERPSPTR